MGHRAFKIHFLFRSGVDEAESMRVEGVPWENFKNILYKLFVLREVDAAQNDIAFVSLVIEEGMPDVPEVCSDLVGAPRF